MDIIIKNNLGEDFVVTMEHDSTMEDVKIMISIDLASFTIDKENIYDGIEVSVNMAFIRTSLC